MTLDQSIARYTPDLEEELLAAFPSGGAGSLPETGPLYGMLKYHLGWLDRDQKPTSGHGGKRIRPLLCLLSCEACGADYRLALSAAAALELVHNFTLIHDDIQDRSSQRRHRPTVWALWGDAQAINVGDALYSIACLGLFRSVARGVRSDVVLVAAEILHGALLSICEGQYLDISFERSDDVTGEMYLAMIARKTAELIGCSAQLGAYLATEDLAVSIQYRDFGRALGMAFQMQDDVLGIWGHPAVTGKPVGDDIYQHKKTLPVLHALEKASVKDKRNLERIFVQGEATSEDVEAATEILTRLGAKEFTEKSAQNWLDQALATLESAAPGQPAGSAMRQLALSLTGRSS